jgi:tetraprenyl-beta-curcumene synthase
MDGPRPCRTAHGERAHAAGALRALVVANARYWPGVAPEVRRELAHWVQPARSIGDPALRELALAKLADEGFNAEIAATLATLAPNARRADTARAIVALELLFDYLDGRTEQPAGDPIGRGLRLYGPFVSSVEQPHPDGERMAHRPAEEAPADGLETPADWSYLTALSDRTRERLFALPGAEAVADVARASAERCAQAQTRLHAAVTVGDEQLRRWAVEQTRGSGLEWREYTAGCASSVLAVHALIAAAADPRTSREDARRIDVAYLAMGAVITILDSVVDRTEDTAGGEAGFIRLYEEHELAGQLCTLTREALDRAREAPHGEHHAMTLAGVAAYYTTHPGAREPHARELARAVRRELSPTIWATLGVMQCWRGAKRARKSMRALAPRHGGRRGREHTDARLYGPT